MFLAPAGNPSSLRFGHPDVATEHTGISPTISLPSLWCEVGERLCGKGANHGLLSLGRLCAEREKEYWGWVPQTACPE